jgi:hypothetical protein
MRIAAVLLIAFLSCVPEAHAQSAPETWVGTWALNVEKSVYNPGPGPYRRGAMTVEIVGDQVRFAYDLVMQRGGVQHMEWTGRFDGEDYMVQGVDDYVTYAYSPVSDREYQVVTKVDRQIVAISTVTVSADGRTLTTSTGGRNARGDEITNVTVYEKVR